MAKLSGSYFSVNATFYPITSMAEALFETGDCYYEVLRVIDGCCLFLTDHLQRLQNSVSMAGLPYMFSVPEVSAIIRELICKNELKNGNIRLVLRATEKTKPVLFTFCVPFSYPSPQEYQLGVSASVFRIIRNNPNIKQYYSGYQQKVGEYIRENRVYEALICDDQDHITEGSKSNVFFIRRNTVFTAPGDKVLKGITREKILILCNNLGYPIEEQSIPLDSLPSMEAVFITGTSPKILPVRRIDHLTYGTDHKWMKNLMAAYDRLILEDIALWQASYNK